MTLLEAVLSMAGRFPIHSQLTVLVGIANSPELVTPLLGGGPWQRAAATGNADAVRLCQIAAKLRQMRDCIKEFVQLPEKSAISGCFWNGNEVALPQPREYSPLASAMMPDFSASGPAQIPLPGPCGTGYTRAHDPA
ncbi:hypothetical protein [Gemmobacter lutimaris]|uniref:hypothetical protein n=1 Tax=Gemmobacter lutimaris TaxID=2306023 RepID=UPI00131432E5|nr:hypothetical protein [Gemmobacter lutimaris]